MEKFGRNYTIKFEIGHRATDITTLIPEEIIEVSYPFTLNFKVSNGVNLSNAGQCSLQILNLNEEIQKKLWKDNYNNQKYILMEFRAGYQDVMPVLFFGFVTQCYSYRESGGVDFITEIQADNNSLISMYGFANVTMSKDTKAYDVIQTLMQKSAGYSPGYITQTIKPLRRNQTFIGQTLDLLKREYEDKQIFIDNNELNILDENDVVPGDLLVITPESGLLGSPRRAERFLSIKMLFEPRLKLAQAIELRSESLNWFNQIYKIVAIEHSGTISPVVCGSVLTQVTLSLGEDPYNELKKSTGNYYSGTQTQGKWLKPAQGQITSKFGRRAQPIKGASVDHRGIDIGAQWGTPVIAPANGKVIFEGAQGGYGYCIQLDHGTINGKKVTSFYAHLSQRNVNIYQNVSQGEVIALSGGRQGAIGAGVSTGPHLHFEVREGDNPVNPLTYIGNY